MKTTLLFLSAFVALTLAPANAGETTGTGFFISPDGYLVTNFHVVEGGQEFVVRIDEEFVPARLVRTDPANDLAILKVALTDHPHLPLSFRAAVRPGDPAFTVGFPDPTVLGLAAKTTRGEISALSGVRDDARFYQTTVEIQPGNSGGPLCDERGNVIAVTTQTINAAKRLEDAGYLPQNINYGLKAAYLRPLIETVATLDAKLAAPIPDDAEAEPFRSVQARVQSAVALVVSKRPDEVVAENTKPSPPAAPAPPETKPEPEPKPEPAPEKSVWIFPGSSTVEIPMELIEAMTKDQLWMARNEIFARNGYIFSSSKGKRFAAYLGDEYHPRTTDMNEIYTHLNKTEESNVQRLLTEEKSR